MAKEEETKEIYYVGVKDPIEVRRSVLESSKELVQYLQRAERFKKVRVEKAAEIVKLKQTMKEISSLIKKLKAALPKTNLRTKLGRHEKEAKAKAIQKTIKEIPVAPKKEVSKEKPQTELQKLEAELAEIESNLTKMS